MASRRDDIFASVFPPANFTTPTPESTPNIGVLASPGGPFGGFNNPSNAADDAAKHSRLWSVATRYLSLPVGGSEQQLQTQVTSDVLGALAHICTNLDSRKELLAWYGNEICQHFRHHVLPELSAWQQPIPVSSAAATVNQTTALLGKAAGYYLNRIIAVVKHVSDRRSRTAVEAFRDRVQQQLHTLTLNSLPRQRLQKTLASVFYQRMKTCLQACGDPRLCQGRDVQCHCTLNLDGVPLSQLHEVGLGGTLAEKAFATAVHRVLQGPAIDRAGFEVDWNGRTTRVELLRQWVQSCFVPFLERCLAAMTGNARYQLTEEDRYTFGDVAVTSLGRKRTAALFDYVRSWPESMGAVLDVKLYTQLRASEDKVQLCNSFIDQCHTRLLHAGASTTEILSIYVSVIDVFRMLDARGVLLEKVAVPLRHYLRSREDTVNIIAASFLAEVDAEGKVSGADMDKVCEDITRELAGPSALAQPEQKSLHWDDMEWQPDPIDAGPDYRGTKHDDILAYVLGLFDPEDFIKEVTTVLAQHLLNGTDTEYMRETRLVELLKSRLDASKLQAAEVMLKDMRDSVMMNKRINPAARYGGANPATPQEIKAAIPEDGISMPELYKRFDKRVKQAHFHAMLSTVANKRKEMWYAKRTRTPGGGDSTPAGLTRKHGETDFKVDVLSSYFWPQLRGNEFRLPDSLQGQETRFEDSFGRLGNQRKLKFRHALAKVTVEIELDDGRQVKEEGVPAWRASVLDAFILEGQPPGMEMGIQELTDTLDMEEELVQDGLAFWIGKRVIYQPSADSYAVLEDLEMDTGLPEAQQAQQPTTGVSALMSQDAMLRESAPMFEAFIANMLRNGGAKEIGGMMGITNMLKMVLPTFTYGDAEVRWLLEQLEGRAEVKREGEMWAIAG